MPNKFKFGVGMFCSMVSIVGFGVLGLVPSSFAQSNSANSLNPIQEFQRSDNADPMSPQNNQNTMFDLIHNSRLGRYNVDYEAVGNQQRQNIQDAAAQFREKQRRALEQRQNGLTPEPATTETIDVQR